MLGQYLKRPYSDGYEYNIDTRQPNSSIEFHFNLSRVDSFGAKKCDDDRSQLYEFDVFFTLDDINTTDVNWTQIPYVSSFTCALTHGDIIK